MPQNKGMNLTSARQDGTRSQVIPGVRRTCARATTRIPLALLEVAMTRRVAGSLAVLLCLCAAAAPAADLSGADANAIRDVTKRYVSNALAGDWNGWASLLSADAVFLPPNGPAVEGRPAIRKWIEAFSGMATFTATPQEVVGTDRVAYARGTFAFTMGPTARMPGGDSGKWLTTYEKQANGSWLIKRNIWNSDSPLQQK